MVWRRVRTADHERRLSAAVRSADPTTLRPEAAMALKSRRPHPEPGGLSRRSRLRRSSPFLDPPRAKRVRSGAERVHRSPERIRSGAERVRSAGGVTSPRVGATCSCSGATRSGAGATRSEDEATRSGAGVSRLGHGASRSGDGATRLSGKRVRLHHRPRGSADASDNRGDRHRAGPRGAMGNDRRTMRLTRPISTRHTPSTPFDPGHRGPGEGGGRGGWLELRRGKR